MKYITAHINPSWRALSIEIFCGCISLRIGKLFIRIGNIQRFLEISESNHFPRSYYEDRSRIEYKFKAKYLPMKNYNRETR